MPMAEYQTLYYIMYNEAVEKLKEQEAEEKAARDDEIKRQTASSSGSLNVMDDKTFEELGIDIPSSSTPVLDRDDPQNKPPIPRGPSISQSDLEEFLEQEGLI